MKKYYLHDTEKVIGPYDREELRFRNIKKDTPVWYEGLAEWTTVEKEPELKDLLDHTKPPPFSSKAEEDSDAEGFYKEYSSYTGTLRVWFVTFGIGGLYLLLTKSELLNKLRETQHIKDIAFLFLLGIGTQIFVAFLNKWVNWYIYSFDGDDSSHFARFVERLSKQFWIDISFDIITCYCFGKIIWMMINIFSS